MKLEYKLEISDYLEYQLYMSSKSKLHNRRRRNSRIVLPVIYLLFAIYAYSNNSFSSLTIILLVLGFVWYLGYPTYSKWKYKSHFQKHVIQNYQKKTESTAVLDFQEEAIMAHDELAESVMPYSSLESYVELKSHFLVKLKSGDSLIIPKRISEDWSEFKSIMNTAKVAFVDELDWEWK